MSWLTYHLVYYAPEKEGLLLDGAAPALQRLQADGLILAAYCLRHWRQGPHLIINLQPAPGAEAAAAERLESDLRRYLEAAPSTVPIDPAAILALHRKLAALELESGPLEPLRPDNHLERLPYQPPFAVAGAAGSEAAAAFYTAITPLLLELMAETRGDPAARLSHLLQMMLTVAAVAGDLQYSHLSFRSHAEAFLNRFDPTGEQRGRFEANVMRNQASLVAMVEQVAELVATGEGEGRLGRWARLLAQQFDHLEPLIAAGAIKLPDQAYIAGQAERLGAAPHLAGDPSRFHRHLLQSELYQRAASSTRFLAMRCLVNWLYSSLALTGITPLERFRLCYMLSRAAELGTGTAWSHLVQTSSSSLAKEE